ncbi:MAG: hypothetical protein IPM45_07610 [Acidimicrobiales bacterium]|nr:hypothetical protein [Acidimicrobiales bacterium]
MTPSAAATPDTVGALLPTRVVLPASCTVPTAPGAASADDTAAGALRDDPAAGLWREPWVSPTLELRDDRDRAAWFHFCHGHHIEFLYWEATAMVCRRAEQAVRAADRPLLERLAPTIVALVEGSAAMLSFCGAFDPEIYDPVLRESMARQRDDFSGDMSSDFLAMATAKRDLYAALTRAAPGHAEVLQQLQAAEQYWYHHHNEVVMTLHPGDSLLKVKVDDLAQRSASFDFDRYVADVVHGDRARHDYDDYFGVVRSDDLTLELYWTQALEKVATVHRHFQLAPDVRRRLLRGDAALLSVISDQLASAPPPAA